ncbi:hypothetical protein LAZ67_2003059 [Cordylochernes scorpioides]|uniref:Uncharacterized protein n=1 Tax=Cordylochernes scorpioides TaxID=51811 RepID=A0ABY6K2G4_9ARAC|nr:hypothetical protein LAZ67_2003059 [Cordylochernes scorpioides]
MPGHRKRRQFKQTDAFTRGMVTGLKRAVIVAVYACGIDVEKGPIRQQLWNAPPCNNVESWFGAQSRMIPEIYSEAIKSVQQVGLEREKLVKAFTSNGIMDKFLGKSNAQQRQAIDNLATALMARTGNTSPACVFAAGVVVHRQQILWPGKMAVIDLTVRGVSMTCVNTHFSHAPEERCRQLQIIAELLDQADLVDVATFFDAALEYTRVATIGSWIGARRLERLLLPSGFCDRVTHYQTIDYAYSDHRDVLIQVGDPAPTRLPCVGKLLELVAEIRSLAPAVAESGGGYIERASLFLRRRLEDDTARSDYPSLSDLGRSLRARRRSPSTFTDDDGNAISGDQLRGFLSERSRSRFAQAPSSAESIADFLAEVTPLEFDDRASGWDILPCEFAKAFEGFFAEVLWQVFEASRLRGALPSSSRRSKLILLPKSHDGPGLQAFRPISLPTSLTHRYWSCGAVRPLLREVFASCEMPLDLQAWLFGVGLHPEGMKITSVAKATIYKYHLGLEVHMMERKKSKLSPPTEQARRPQPGTSRQIIQERVARPPQPPKKHAVTQLKNSRQQQALRKSSVKRQLIDATTSAFFGLKPDEQREDPCACSHHPYICTSTCSIRPPCDRGYPGAEDPHTNSP